MWFVICVCCTVHLRVGAERKVTHPASSAYKCGSLLAQVLLALRLGSLVHFFPCTCNLSQGHNNQQQLESLLKHQTAHLSLTILFNMATRWGLCGAGKISHDYSVAMKTLPPEDHQVLKVTLSHRMSNFAPNRAAD